MCALSLSKVLAAPFPALFGMRKSKKAGILKRRKSSSPAIVPSPLVYTVPSTSAVVVFLIIDPVGLFL